MVKGNRFWLSASLMLLMGIVGFAAGPAHAQFIGDDFGGFGNNSNQRFGNGPVGIERFTLAGNGCPNRNELATIQQRGNTSVLRFQFNGGGRPFQVNGPGNIARSCTIQVRLFNNTGRPFNAALGRVAEGVTFVNRINQGQILVRSQFALGEDASNVRAFRLQNTPNARANTLQLNGFNVVAPFQRRLEVRAIVQLQLQGQNNAALRLDNLTMEVLLRPVGGGGGFGGGFIGGGGGQGPFVGFF